MPCQEIEARVAQVFSRKGRAGVALPDLDLFGEHVPLAAVARYAGRHRIPLRIMIALLHLRHAFNESDEGVKELLAQTIKMTVGLKRIKPQELSHVVVDSTEQQRANALPTDSRLLETARVKLLEVAKDASIVLKQTFSKEGTNLSRKAGRYAHARQYMRMRRAIKRQRTIVTCL